jgi:hypothetical protein
MPASPSATGTTPGVVDHGPGDPGQGRVERERVVEGVDRVGEARSP